MADQATDPGATALQQFVRNALAELAADSDRLGRAVRAALTDANHVPLEVFTSLATARRHALAFFAKTLSADASDPLRETALTGFSALAAALGSQYRSLSATNATAREREHKLAKQRFAVATKAFADLDHALGKG